MDFFENKNVYKEEDSHTVTYTSDVPDEKTPWGRVPISKQHMIGIDLLIDVLGDADTGDPGYIPADYDVLAAILTPISEVKFGITESKDDIHDLRSDTLLFLHSLFMEFTYQLDTMPTAATGAATHYYAHLFIPLKITKEGSKGSYYYKFKMRGEAEYITTVANWTMTSITFTFNNVYCDSETYAKFPNILTKSYQTDAINSTAGKNQSKYMDDGDVQIGFIISGEQEGTVDLDGVLVKDGEDVIFDESLESWEQRQIELTHNQAPYTSFANTMIAIHKPYMLNASSVFKIKTTASQDFQFTQIIARGG